jgi:hypothetical protein
MLGYLERELIPVNAESDDFRVQVIRLNSGFPKAELIRTPPPKKKGILRINEFNSALIYPSRLFPFAIFQTSVFRINVHCFLYSLRHYP